ncbi:MAG: hypothetical protein ACKVP3_18605 [Hyphomicrobiaceae bacterium]
MLTGVQGWPDHRAILTRPAEIVERPGKSGAVSGTAPSCKLMSLLRRKLVQHHWVPGRAGAANVAQWCPDEGASIDPGVDQGLGVDILQAPDAATRLNLGMTGLREVGPALAGGLRVIGGGVAEACRTRLFRLKIARYLSFFNALASETAHDSPKRYQ